MKKEEINISNLVINPENPRFERAGSQQKAIDLMLKKIGKRILRLAEDIAKNGLNPSKSLMVIEVEKGKFLPMEGNRRVIALKLLHNPERASDKKFVDAFEKLKKEYSSQIPTTVSCVIFPDKESAFRWVNLEHTGENQGIGIVKWNSEQRQRFIAQYGGKNASRQIQIFDFADQNNIEHSKVDLTTLERLISTPFVREQIGINFSKGVLDLEKPRREVIRNLKSIFSTMSQKNFKVTDVYTVDKRINWIKKILKIRYPVENKKDDEEPNLLFKKESLDGDWITHQLHSVYPGQNRVKAILGELKNLNPKQQPNVCAASLRVLLELAVYIFLKESGEITVIINEEKKRFIEDNEKRKKKKEWDKYWAPNFQRTLNHMIRSEIIKDPQERKAINTYISKNSKEPFLVELNLFIHNPDYEPKPEAVIDIWNKLGKLLFRTILGLEENAKS